MCFSGFIYTFVKVTFRWVAWFKSLFESRESRHIGMFRVKWRRRWLISKSSFSRQCVGRIRDTCSQLTWKSHTPYTQRHFLTYPNPAQTLYLHESCQNKPKSKVCKTATSHFVIHVASSSVVYMILIHAASYHDTYVHTQTDLQLCTKLIKITWHRQ